MIPSLLLAAATSIAAPASGAIGVAVDGADRTTEICRYAAGDRHDPFERFLKSHEAVCEPVTESIVLPKGLWNVFARGPQTLSRELLLIDGELTPREIALTMAPAAALEVTLPPQATAVVYSPSRTIAWPASPRTVVPAAEELWLIVRRKEGMAVLPMNAIEAGASASIDARPIRSEPSLLGWIRLEDEDRDAAARTRGISSPQVRHSLGTAEKEAARLPSPENLDGAFVFIANVPPGRGELTLSGRGWMSDRTAAQIADSGVTAIRQPLRARATTTVTINWSTTRDLATLDRSLGSCEPSHEAARLELSVFRCPDPRPGEPTDPSTCTLVRTFPLDERERYGTVTLEEVPPGYYRAEARYGKLPPSAVIGRMAPLQNMPMSLRMEFLAAYGSLTRGGKPLGEDVQLEFPNGGVGFSARDKDEYAAVLKMPPGVDTVIEATGCESKRSDIIVTDAPMSRSARYDLDIPDNVLIIDVVDTFTRTPLKSPTLKYEVLSQRFRRPIFTRTIRPNDESARESDDQRFEQRRPGRFVLRGLPARELVITVTHLGYQKQQVPRFSLTKSETRELEVQLVPLRGTEGKIHSSRPFANATITWYSRAGGESGSSEIASDGTFFFDGGGDVMVVVSSSHPLWIAPFVSPRRGQMLELRFPDTAPVRDADLYVSAADPGTSRTFSAFIGDLRIPAAALHQHLQLRSSRPLIRGSGPLHVAGLAETGPIEFVLGPVYDERSVRRGGGCTPDSEVEKLHRRRLIPNGPRLILEPCVP